jgi:hypothetical protein
VFFATETTGSASSLVYSGGLSARATDDSPLNWSNFRASVRLRWGSGVVGLDVRRVSSADLLRLTLDRSTGERRLFALAAGTPLPLADDVTTFPDPGTDVSITIECVDDRVQVFAEGSAEPVFDVEGAPAAAGALALYADGAPGARFTEVRVDDLRAAPSAAFTFDFVTSRYANFHHHLQSFQDRLFDGAPGDSLGAADLSAAAAASVTVPAAGNAPLGQVLDPEWRAFDALEAKALGVAALRTPENLEISRVSAAGAPLALMIRSPEPLLWDRVSLQVSETDTDSALTLAESIKISHVTFAASDGFESVTVLIREKSNLSRHRLEWRPLPTGADPNPTWATYLSFAENESDFEDGTQVRVLALPELPEREPGTVQRLVQALVHFTAPGVELRVIGPGERIVHQRRFSTPDAFAAFPMQAVRKLDGTAALLFTPAMVTAPAGLRLHWQFARALPEEDLRHRQGGSEIPEIAVLDLALP